MVLLGNDGEQLGRIRVTAVDVLRFDEVTWEFADAEGEGFSDIEDWRITLINFATHDPEQNPIEEVWHQGKTDLREQRLEATHFSEVIEAFEARLERQIFDFPKLRMYEPSRPE